MIGLYLLIAALSFLLLYFALKKLTLNIDEKALLEPIKSDIYPNFVILSMKELENLRMGFKIIVLP